MGFYHSDRNPKTANERQSEITSHLRKIQIKETETINAGEDVESKECFYILLVNTQCNSVSM